MGTCAPELLLAALLALALCPPARPFVKSPPAEPTERRAPAVCYGNCRCGVVGGVLRGADAAPDQGTGGGVLQRRRRFVSGQPVRTYSYPWLAAVTRLPPYYGFSTGALISNKHVLTAASAVAGVPESHLRVTLSVGAMCGLPDSRAINVSVASVASYHSFGSAEAGDDLAVLTLPSPVRFTASLHPVCLPPSDRSTYGGRTAAVVGFGGNGTEKLDAAVTLAPNAQAPLNTGYPSRCRPRELLLPLVAPSACAPPTQLPTTGCAGSPSAPAVVCPSDAGSLVQVTGERREFQLVGVISGRNNCTSGAEGPAQFTRTAPTLRWLLNQISDGCVCPAP